MNPSTAQARAIVVALAKHGVQQVVMAPGSRNAPLSLALAQQSEVGLSVRIDERTAAFTALGMAKASGLPVAVLCTSGTAVANLTPAVYEAHEAGVPLLLLTADRPPSVRGRGANQTIEQVGIFANALRAEFDLPLASEQDEVYWELAVANAITQTLGDEFTAPGPVQVNIPFAEPLVPDDSDTSWSAAVRLGSLQSTNAVEPPELAPLLSDMGIDTNSPRGIVICSDPRSNRPATALAKLLQWPMFVEPGGGPRTADVAIRHYAKLLAQTELRPDVVITCGRFGLARSVTKFVAEFPQIAVGRYPLDADPAAHASHHLTQVPLPLQVGAAPSDWLQSWKIADAAVSEAESSWSSQQAAATLLSHCNADDLLYVAASMPLRIVDDLLSTQNSPRVLVNRGANGIDGLIAAATGAALVNQTGNTYLLIGDVAALHDLSSFVLPAQAERPKLQILVLDNGGGAIFAKLEQGADEFSPWFDQVFGTSHTADIASVANALGWKSVVVDSADELKMALSAGSEVIVAKLPALN